MIQTYRTFALCISAFTVVVAIFCATGTTRSFDHRCEPPQAISTRVGSFEFDIPSEYAPLFFTEGKNLSLSDRDNDCYQKFKTKLDVKGWTIQLDSYSQKNETVNFASTVQMFYRLAPGAKLGDSYTRKIESGRISFTENEKLKSINGIVAENSNGSLFRIYHDVRTPSGNPILFECPSRVWKTIIKKVELGRRCRTVVSFGNEAILNIVFFDRTVPEEKLKNLIEHLYLLVKQRFLIS